MYFFYQTPIYRLYIIPIISHINTKTKYFAYVSFQIVVTVLSIGLFVLALYDVLYSKRPGGDPTMMIDAASPSSATTINNPGFKEPKTKNGKPENQLHFK